MDGDGDHGDPALEVSRFPTLAPDHPSDEDLSPGTPVSRKMGHGALLGVAYSSFSAVTRHSESGFSQSAILKKITIGCAHATLHPICLTRAALAGSRCLAVSSLFFGVFNGVRPLPHRTARQGVRFRAAYVSACPGGPAPKYKQE